MIIGSTKETINNECRVALTPAMVKSYIKFGFKVVIESNLGQKSSLLRLNGPLHERHVQLH